MTGETDLSAADKSAPRESRRSFLAALLGVGSVFVAALLSVPLIRFALFPLIRRTTELKGSPVGELSEFASSTEPVMRTIRIEQVDGWRKAVSEKAVYVTRDGQGQVRGLHRSLEQREERVHLPLPRGHLCPRRKPHQRPVPARDGYFAGIG